ncbi:MAG: tetratricopeptide repeat protein [candidate division Zixibacteria bacterium]|nr:tetratricopeptide repeat protein [candidate division Zixibacteria bacterium]
MMMNTIKVTFFLILSLVVFVLGSCSDNQAVRLRYEVEKLYYQAIKQVDNDLAKSAMTRSERLKAAASRFGDVWQFSLNALDSIDSKAYPVERREVEYLAFRAVNKLSQLHFSVRHYDTCVKILNRLMTVVPLDNSPLVTTMLNLGQAIQASGSWDSALVVYDSAIERFYPPVDETGQVIHSLLGLPLHIFRVVNVIGDSTAARERFDSAERYYRDLINQSSLSKVVVASRISLARLYEHTGQWEQVIAELSPLADSTVDNYLDARIRIADVYATRLRKSARAQSMYEEILNEIGSSDTLLRPQVLFKLSIVMLDQKKYTEARGILVDIKRNYPGYYSITPLTQLNMARTFELSGNWSRAETEYEFLIEKYRGSDEAMSTFLYLADHLEEQGREDESDKWRRDAEHYYDRVAVKGTGTMMEARALVYKAELFYRKADWETSAAILIELFEKFPDSNQGQEAALRAAAMYRNKLNDPDRADTLLERLRSSLIQINSDWGA